MDQDFSKYRVLVAPMLYMVKPGVAERVERFVAAGGTFVATYASGFVDEHDLCFLGGFPGPLRKVLGVWDEETDALYDEDAGRVRMRDGGKTYAVRHLCALIHAEGAEVLADYDADFYAGRPALTRHRFGMGQAFYVAFRNHADFETDFYGGLAKELHLSRALEATLPDGVTAQVRTDGTRDFVFVMNFTPKPQTVEVAEGRPMRDALVGDAVANGRIELAPLGCRILERERSTT
jgi:beta-galactosidase